MRLPVVVVTRAAVVVLVGASAAFGADTSSLARIAGKPDFNGIWQANNTANWDLQNHAPRPMVSQLGIVAGSSVLAAPVVALGTLGWVPGGLGVVEGEEIPYLPWAAARKRENLEHWLDRDPGDQMLPTRRATCNVYAVSVPNRSECQQKYKWVFGSSGMLSVRFT